MVHIGASEERERERERERVAFHVYALLSNDDLDSPIFCRIGPVYCL